MRAAFVSSAPGRLCLFGEHQDYLGLPVIAMAMNRRCHLQFNPVEGGQIKLTSAILGNMDAFGFHDLIGKRQTDPLRHALGSLLKEFGIPENGGWHIHVDSDIPVRAGCSSSTALMTAWIAGWLKVLNGGCSTDDIVARCHQYEVLDFNGAGGNMDQFACGHGGLRRFGSGAPVELTLPEGVFILGDSGQPKDTQGHLRRCREARIPLMPHIDEDGSALSADELSLLAGTRINRDLEAKWGSRMALGASNGAEFGGDLSHHHAVLRDVLGLSTPRIESMLDAAIAAGAWGGKINGSGGGGCCFVLCDESKVQKVMEAMEMAGAAGAWQVEMEGGVACNR